MTDPNNRCDRCGMDVRHDVSEYEYYVCGNCENDGYTEMSIK